MDKPCGYNGRILRVDLTAGTTASQELPEAVYRRYLGGGGLALYFLLRELEPGTDPLGEGNLLVFAASVVTGTPGMGFNRYSVAARSPLTGAFGESEAGGWWGPELKFAGYDAVLIRGRSERPVYLWIHDGQAELRDASALWGLFSREATQAIKKELGDERARVAVIGPGG
jgi:aldehyde:ferredoxin oxidoreductase